MLSKDRNVYRAVLVQVDIHMYRFLRFEVGQKNASLAYEVMPIFVII
jgi:hypothetical protein